MGPSPVVSRLDPGRVRGRAHDRGSARIRRADVVVSRGCRAVGGAFARAKLRGSLRSIRAQSALAHHPVPVLRSVRADLRGFDLVPSAKSLEIVHRLKFGSPSASTSAAPFRTVVTLLPRVPPAPCCRNTIECCEGTSNFFPHVLHVTESSTRIM